MSQQPTAKPSQNLREKKRTKTQALLFDTAAELIAKKGYSNVTVEDICDSAEVARATFFRYFGSKSGLIIEFDRRIVLKIESQLTAENLSVADKLAIVQTSMATAWNDVHPNLRALGLDYLKSTPVSDMSLAVADIKALTSQIIRQGLESGELTSPLSPDILADVLINSIRIGIYSAASKASSFQLEQTTAQVLELLLYGCIGNVISRNIP